MQMCYRLGNGTIVSAESDHSFSIKTEESGQSFLIEIQLVELKELLKALACVKWDCQNWEEPK